MLLFPLKMINLNHCELVTEARCRNTTETNESIARHDSPEDDSGVTKLLLL